MDQQQMSEQDSLRLIGEMIQKAKNSYHDSGLGTLLWGTIIPICSLVTWSQIHFNFKLPFDIWMLTIIAVIPQIIIVQKEKRTQKARPYDQTMMDYVWTCFGISICLLIFININILQKLSPVFEKYMEVTGSSPPYNYSGFITSFFLLLYGIPTIITGGCMKFKAMLWGGILCWACCIISVFTNLKTDMLLTAFAAIVAWLIPGLILRKKYLKSVSQHV